MTITAVARPDPRTLAQLAPLLAAVAPGCVVTHRMVASALGTTIPRVMQIVAGLAAHETALPWWRIVADGGAIGRLSHRDAQIEKLKAEGLLVSPAGIVQGLAGRIAGAPDAGPFPVHSSGTAPSRARGMKGKPSSTV